VEDSVENSGGPSGKCSEEDFRHHSGEYSGQDSKAGWPQQSRKP